MHEHLHDPEIAHEGSHVEREQEPQHREVQHALAEGSPQALGQSSVMHLQRAAGNASVSAFVQREEDDRHPVKDVVESGSGRPLEPEVRVDMEQRLGHDFSDVRVHTDPKAADSAKAVQARAYTSGSNVVFDDGQYRPDTPEGSKTLAHELTHVVQQRSGPVDGTPAAGGIRVSSPSDQYEQAADAAAETATRTDPAPVPAVQGAPIQRQETAPEDEEEVQTVQRQEAPEEEEEVQTVQRQEAPEEEEAVQSIQRQEAPPEEEEEEAPAAGT